MSTQEKGRISLPWIFLFIAGFAEVGSVLSLKKADGFTKFYPTISCIIFGSLSFYFLSLSLTKLSAGTAYANWTGIGSIGSVIAGIMFFDEPKKISSFFFISCIIAGVAGIKSVS